MREPERGGEGPGGGDPLATSQPALDDRLPIGVVDLPLQGLGSCTVYGDGARDGGGAPHDRHQVVPSIGGKWLLIRTTNRARMGYDTCRRRSYPEFSARGRADQPPGLAKAVKDHFQAQIHIDIPTPERPDDSQPGNSNASVESQQQFLAEFTPPGFTIDPDMGKSRWRSGATPR